MVYLVENDIDDYLDIKNNSFLISVKYSYELKIDDLEMDEVNFSNKKRFKIIHVMRVDCIRTMTCSSVDSFWSEDVIMMEKL